MIELVQNKQYYFIGSKNLIENTLETNYYDNEKIFLGKFIEFIGVPHVCDWLYDGKAKFEFGVISKGYYDNICIEI